MLFFLETSCLIVAGQLSMESGEWKNRWLDEENKIHRKLMLVRLSKNDKEENIKSLKPFQARPLQNRKDKKLQKLQFFKMLEIYYKKSFHFKG